MDVFLFYSYYKLKPDEVYVRQDVECDFQIFFILEKLSCN